MEHSPSGMEQKTTAPAEDTARALLVIENVSKTFRLADGSVQPALGTIDLKVRDGEFVSIIGPSGCGKSTLFGIIGGLVPPDSGRILIDNEPASGIHRDVGLVFQEESTFGWRTILENVLFPLEIAGVPRKEAQEKARRFIRMVGLAGFEDRYPASLSGGMRQRTALARTLAYEPRILLMDEPFAAVDEQTRLLLGDQVLRIWRELRQTTLLITHSINEAVQMSDRVIVMSYRPGVIKRIVEVDLPRPRDSAMLSSEAFGRYVGLIWDDLREEASRGMAASIASPT